MTKWRYMIAHDAQIDLENIRGHIRRFKKAGELSEDDLLIKDDKLNNDFVIDFSEKLKIYGSKYDASNLTNAFDNNESNNFFTIKNPSFSIFILYSQTPRGFPNKLLRHDKLSLSLFSRHNREGSNKEHCLEGA